MKQIYLYIFLFFFYDAIGQQIDSTQQLYKSNKHNNLQKFIIVGLIVQQTGSFAIQYNWWWRGQEKPLNIDHDSYFYGNSLGVDKFGHFYTSYFYCHALNELFTLGNFNPKSKTIISAALPTLWAISIELGDGFSKYGFSIRDFSSNMLGLGFAVLQQRYKPLQNVKVKLGYYPTAGHIENNFKNWNLSSDYGGHIYWLTFHMNDLVADNYKKFFPPYLNFAIGYGIDEYGVYSTKAPSRKFCIGLDWNLGAIKTKNKYVKTARNILDYIHLPAPGIVKTDEKGTQLKTILLR